MPPAFVQSLLQRATANATITLSGSKVVTLGNTIFVAFGGDPTTVNSVTDNLGNTYTSIGRSGPTAGALACCAELFRADVTKPGTLTTITIQKSTSNVGGAIALEFSGVGAVRSSGSTPAQSFATASAFPGPDTGNVADYVANDLWIGAFAQESSNAFSPVTADPAVAALEPTAEQISGSGTSGVSAGCLYYISGTGGTGKRLTGQWTAASYSLGVGVAVQPAAVPIVYNDAPSGTLSLSGSCVDTWVKRFVNNDAPAGSIVLAGSVVESYSTGLKYNDAPSGRIVLAGAATDQSLKSYIDAPTATLALSGTATDSWTVSIRYTDAPVGAIRTVGTVVQSVRYIDARTGRLTPTGTVAESQRRVVTPAPVGTLRLWGWPAEMLPSGLPRPVGIPGRGETGRDPVVNPTTLRPSTVTNYAVGDVLLCYIVGDSGTGIDFQQVPDDWEHIVNIEDANSFFHLFARVADSVEVPAPTFVLQVVPGSGGSRVVAQVVAFRYLDTRVLTEIVDVLGGVREDTHSTGLIPTGDPIITEQNDDLVLSLGSWWFPGPYIRTNPPSGFGLVGAIFTSMGDNGVHTWAYQVKRQAGVVPTQNFGVITGISPDPRIARGVMVALKAMPVESHTSTPAGTLSLTGARTAKHAYTDRPTGAIAAAGTIKSESHVESPRPTATLKLSGSVVEEWTHTGSELAGALPIAGKTVEKLVHDHVVAADLTLDGALEEDFHILLGDDKPVGSIVFGGALELASVFVDERTGDLILDGVAGDEYRSGSAVDYNDRMTGVLRLKGRAVHLRPPGFSSLTGRILVSDRGRLVTRQDGRAVTGTTGRKVNV